MLNDQIIRNIEDMAAENMQMYGPLTDEQIETQATFEFEAGNFEDADRDDFISAWMRGAKLAA